MRIESNKVDKVDISTSSEKPESDDHNLFQVFSLHEDLLKDVASVFFGAAAAANRAKDFFFFLLFHLPFCPLCPAFLDLLHESFILVGVEDEDGEASRLSFTNERQLTSSVQRVVDD